MEERRVMEKPLVPVRFLEETFCPQKVFNILSVFHIWGSDLLEADEIINRGNSEAEIFLGVFFQDGIFVAIFEPNRLVIDVSDTSLEKKIKFS